MTEPVTPQEMYRRMMVAFKSRKDVGLRKMAANQVLTQPNPFQPDAKRRLSPGTILILSIAAFGLASFVYFNYLP